MKRLILFLLIGALLILPLSGCFADKQNEGTTPNNTTENTTPEATTPEVTTPDNPPEVTTPPENNQENTPTVGEELDKNSTLVWVLSDFWTSYDAIIDWHKSSLADKVENIKDGTQALHVFFDPSNYYYVAGYYNPTHSYEEKSCCTLKYNWVKYENETQIQEYYNGMKCRVVIQINKELHATNIVSKESTIADLEYIQLYTPLFTDGVNTAAPIVFDGNCFYLREDYEGTLYICKDIVYYYNVLLSSVCLDGQYYMPILLTRLEKGETLDVEKVFSGNSFREEFGEYYDAIRAMMVFNKYSLEYDGKISHYGLIPMDEFVNLITLDNPPEVTTPPENNQDDPPTVGEVLNPKTLLVYTLAEYWDNYFASVDTRSTSLPTKFDRIKTEKQALHVFFDPSNYYYVCGYYNPTHSHNERNCCVWEYNWVKYESETEILEYYDDMKCRVVFQINKEASATDIVSGEKVTANVEYFQLYTPVFVDGINTAACTLFENNFIYLHSPDSGILYDNYDNFYIRIHDNRTLPHVYFEGEYYISIYLNTVRPNQAFNIEETLSLRRSSFGEYYDKIIDVMDIEKYSVLCENGDVKYYGLVSFEDFANRVVR